MPLRMGWSTTPWEGLAGIAIVATSYPTTRQIAPDTVMKEPTGSSSRSSLAPRCSFPLFPWSSEWRETAGAAYIYPCLLYTVSVKS